VNYKVYIQKHFKDVRWAKNGKEARLNCINPQCTDKRGNADIEFHLYVNVVSGFFICPRCQWKGNFWSFISFIENISWKEVYHTYQEDLDDVSLVDFKKVIENKIFIEEEEPEKKVFKGVEGFGFPIMEIEENTYAYKYLVGRGIGMDKIKQYKLRYCITGAYAFRIIIPIYENQKLVYFVARTYIDDHVKVKNPSLEAGFLPREEVLFGYDNVKGLNWAVLVEGAFDAIASPNGLGILGKFLSEKQLFKIKSLGIELLYVMLDGDAREVALDLGYNRLKSWGIQVKFVDLGKNEDPSSIGHDECVKRLHQAEELTFTNFIRKKLEA